MLDTEAHVSSPRVGEAGDATPVAADPSPPAPGRAEVAGRTNGGSARRVRVFPMGPRDVFLGIIAAAAIIYLLGWAEPILVPLVVSVLVAAVLEPVVQRCVRWHIPRTLAAAVLVLLVAVVVGAGTYKVMTQAAEVVRDLPETTKRLRMITSSYLKGESAVAQLRKAADELDKATATTRSTTPGVTKVEVVERPVDVGSLLWTGWMGALDIGGRLVFAFFLTFFLLSSGDLFRRKVVRLMGSGLSDKRVTVQMLDQMRATVSHFLVHLLVTSTVVGVASWLAYVWLGVQQAAFWGLAAGMLNVVPYIGASAASLGAAMASLTQTGSLQHTLLVGGVALTITSLEGFLLTPLLLRRSAELNPVATTVGLAFWTWLWGVWGMLLGVPIMMLLKTIGDHVDELRPLADWLGSD